jgi:hypothetical protein
MATLLISGSAILTGCTGYSGAYTPAGYAGVYGYGYGTEPSAGYVPPPLYGYGGTAYLGGPVYGDGGDRWRDHDDWDRHRWQNNPAQAERWRQEQQNAALYRQQVQQNRQIYQQNLAKYNQQVQENRATYQRQLTEARQKKAPGQQ